MSDNWKYYKFAMLPACMPYEEPDTSLFTDRNLWKRPIWKKALFAKYTTDFDCKTVQPWYWIICDTPFDWHTLKSKFRNEMKKALDNFEVRVIDPTEYVDELFEVKVSALSSYPKAYRAIPTREEFERSIPTFKKPCFAAFCKLDGKLAGFINMVEMENALLYSGHHVMKDYEKLFVNYALILGMLDYYNPRLKEGCMLVDGERNINHNTNHQELLVKKFGFRKAYCKLHLKYRPIMGILIKCLYPFKSLLRELDSFKPIHAINGVLLLESIRKEQEKE